jgi:hypothetical protein
VVIAVIGRFNDPGVVRDSEATGGDDSGRRWRAFILSTRINGFGINLRARVGATRPSGSLVGERLPFSFRFQASQSLSFQAILRSETRGAPWPEDEAEAENFTGQRRRREFDTTGSRLSLSTHCFLIVVPDLSVPMCGRRLVWRPVTTNITGEVMPALRVTWVLSSAIQRSAYQTQSLLKLR